MLKVCAWMLRSSRSMRDGTSSTLVVYICTLCTSTGECRTLYSRHPMDRDIIDSLKTSIEAMHACNPSFSKTTGCASSSLKINAMICTHSHPNQHLILSRPSPHPLHPSPPFPLHRPRNIITIPIQLPSPPHHHPLTHPHHTLLPLLSHHPRLPPPQPPPLHPLHLRTDIFSFRGYLIQLLLCGPEIADAEFVVEVRAEIVHPAYGEHDVHAELLVMYISLGRLGLRRERVFDRGAGEDMMWCIR